LERVEVADGRMLWVVRVCVAMALPLYGRCCGEC